MTQDERWQARYNEVKTFIEEGHRNPSRHRIEDHDMLNWLKVNRKKDECRGIARATVGNIQRAISNCRTV